MMIRYIDKFFSKNLRRRDFLKIAFAGSAALSLESLIGCAPTLKETREDVVKINWDCNPILPIPAKGCYTGTNYQAHPGHVARFFQRYYGILPTFHAIGHGRFGAANHRFPEDDCKAAIEKGVIPVIRYVVVPDRETYRKLVS